VVDIHLPNLAAGLIDAFNKSDWAAFTEGVTTDVMYAEIGTGNHTEGIKAYVELMRAWKQGFPDGAATIRNAVSDGDTVVQEIKWSGTHTGLLKTPAGSMPATGKRVEIQASVWIMF
jgi:predicted ester cyclase